MKSLLLITMILWCNLLLAKNVQSPVDVSKKYSPIVALAYPDGYIFCTAFVITDSLAITAGHCVVSDECMTSLFKKGCNVSKDRIFAVDPDAKVIFEVKPSYYMISSYVDIATIEGDFRGFNKVKINLKDFKLKEGDKLKHCGFARGTPPYVCTYGNYLGVKHFSGKSTGLVIPGMSGGPVFDKNDVVIGLNASGDEEFSLFSPVLGLIPITE